ncbi:MAG: hypothetical protein ABIW47_16345, partial [Ginsengibacter sp.]
PNYELEFQKDFGLKLCNVVQASGFPAVGFKFIDPKSENPAGTRSAMSCEHKKNAPIKDAFIKRFYLKFKTLNSYVFRLILG